MSYTRRFFQVVAFLATLIVGATAMAVIITQTTWFKEWLRGFIIKQADDYVNGRLTIGRIDGNLFFGVEAEDIDITQNGQPVISLKDVGIDYSFLTFLGGNVVLDHIRLNEPTIHLQKTATGWNLTELIKAQTPTAKSNRRPIDIGEIGISGGTLYVDDTPNGETVGTTGVAVIAPAWVAVFAAADGRRLWERQLPGPPTPPVWAGNTLIFSSASKSFQTSILSRPPMRVVRILTGDSQLTLMWAVMLPGK